MVFFIKRLMLDTDKWCFIMLDNIIVVFQHHYFVIYKNQKKDKTLKFSYF